MSDVKGKPDRVLYLNKIYWTIFLFLLVMLISETSIVMKTPNSFLEPKLLQQVFGTYQKQTYRSHDYVVHIAFTSCGGRKDESFVLVKSAVLLTNTTVMFHIFTERPTRSEFEVKLNQMKRDTGVQFYFKLYDVDYPDTKNVNSKEWRRLFAPCSSLRLFYHTLMPTIDAVLYVDTDTLFLTAPEDVWSMFGNFNASHLVGMAPEQTGKKENSTNSWYEIFKDTPHYGEKGLNSGVMLMNLTRLRAKPWIEDLAKILKNYKEHVRLGDQDLLNILFHFKPELVLLCPCEINYRADFCAGAWLMCERPAKVAHGNRQVWHHAGQLAFRAIYEAFEKLVDPKRVLPMIVEASIDSTNETWCGKRVHLLVEELYKHLT